MQCLKYLYPLRIKFFWDFQKISGFTIVCIGKQLSFRINYSPYGYNFKGKYSNIEGRKIG